jgi:hypothetical protein
VKIIRVFLRILGEFNGDPPAPCMGSWLTALRVGCRLDLGRQLWVFQTESLKVAVHRGEAGAERLGDLGLGETAGPHLGDQGGALDLVDEQDAAGTVVGRLERGMFQAPWVARPGDEPASGGVPRPRRGGSSRLQPSPRWNER